MRNGNKLTSAERFWWIVMCIFSLGTLPLLKIFCQKVYIDSVNPAKK